MKVKCINNKNVSGTLKINAEYEVMKETKETFVIKIDKGTKGAYLKERFERVEDADR